MYVPVRIIPAAMPSSTDSTWTPVRSLSGYAFPCMVKDSNASVSPFRDTEISVLRSLCDGAHAPPLTAKALYSWNLGVSVVSKEHPDRYTMRNSTTTITFISNTPLMATGPAPPTFGCGQLACCTATRATRKHLQGALVCWHSSVILFVHSENKDRDYFRQLYTISSRPCSPCQYGASHEAPFPEKFLHLRRCFDRSLPAGWVTGTTGSFLQGFAIIAALRNRGRTGRFQWLSAIPPVTRRHFPTARRKWRPPAICQHDPDSTGNAPCSGRKWLVARVPIIEARPPIATAFNRSWMPFRTLRCRWPFLFLRNWVSRRSSTPRLRPSWIWPVWSRATMSPWRESGVGSGCDPPRCRPANS